MPPDIKRPDINPTVFHGMVSVSPQMNDLFALLARVARSQASVLLRGETGTGKELAARAIHALSSRASGPFRAVNCASLTPDLAASELFGHLRGAFTGAVADRAGLFSLVDKGTAFLDEVAELSLPMQARLLRVLQERTFVPVGGTAPVSVDMRLITATHRSLRTQVEERRFREDLMYRVRVVPVFIPPLVERHGDLDALTWVFIDRFNRTGTRQVRAISARAHHLLHNYAWPGNVRELRNVVEHAFAVGTTSTIEPTDLPPELRGELPPARQSARHSEEDERQRLTEALRLADGRKSQAADLLGMSRTTLWRKLRELGLS